jgi:aspartyl-tRNA(Asn)/glutamyl-tRNA(Gln) amidotransferase subunit B
MEYEPVIGLEIHVQLNCRNKMFCDCPNIPGERPNINTCPICLWMPGAIPQFSGEALEKATLTCLAMNCEINHRSAFDQKVYYYPDLPKGFQLSQFNKQLAKNGWLDIIGEDGKPKRLRIHEIHMEEDVAKLVHETEGQTRISLVDFNRAGAPLVEIVTEPDMRSPHDAMEFLRMLRMQIRYVDTADCSMESGTMRADANISLRPKGSDEFNTKVEVKNMNSIRAVGDAISHEIARQTELLNSGKEVILHTRLWDPLKNVTTPMRGKFSGPCVPDPSVPEIVITEEWLSEMRARLPEMPGQKRIRFVKQFGLTEEEAALLSADREVAHYFEDMTKDDVSPRTIAQWIAARLIPALKQRNQSITETPVTPRRFSGLLHLLEQDKITANAAREVFDLLFETGKSAEEIVEERKLGQIGETSELESILDKILSENPDAVANFKSGKTQASGFLIGQAMRATKGKANPKLLKELLEKKLG